MNALNKVAPLPPLPAALPHGELANLLLHPELGLIQATKLPALHELCLGLGEHFAAVARGTGSSRGLLNLLPLLLEDAQREQHERKVDRQQQRVLLAVRLIWASPQRGARGLRLARRAWARALGLRPEEALRLAV